MDSPKKQMQKPETRAILIFVADDRDDAYT